MRIITTLVLGVGLVITSAFAPAMSCTAQSDSDAKPPTTPARRPVRDRPNTPTDRRNDAPQVRVPPGVEFMRDVVYATVKTNEGADRDLTMNVCSPRDDGGDLLPAVIYIHGGGFTSGDKNTGNPFSVAFAQGGYLACTISYRLVHEARFPAALHDVKAAVRFLRANAEELGIDPQRIGVWGHSAGGHLAAFLGTTGNDSETHGDVGDFDDTSSAVACVVDFFGTSDLALLAKSRGRRGAGIGQRLLGDVEDENVSPRLRSFSPIAWVDADDPPFLIIHGDEDSVVPIEQSKLLDKELREQGVETELVVVEGAGHGINDEKIMLRAFTFFDEHLGGDAAGVARRHFDARRQQQRQRRQNARDRATDG